jgi:hypothetical protein
MAMRVDPDIHERVRVGLAAVAEWEADQGALSHAEMAAAHRRVADQLAPARRRRRPFGPRV